MEMLQFFGGPRVATGPAGIWGLSSLLSLIVIRARDLQTQNWVKHGGISATRGDGLICEGWDALRFKKGTSDVWKQDNLIVY